jgi:hypothetical protein
MFHLSSFIRLSSSHSCVRSLLNTLACPLPRSGRVVAGEAKGSRWTPASARVSQASGKDTRAIFFISLSLAHSICPPLLLSVGVSSFLSWQGAWFGCVRGQGANSLVRAGVGGGAISACSCWANPPRVLSWIKRAVRVPELCSRQTRTDAHVCVCVCTSCTHCVNRGQ